MSEPSPSLDGQLRAIRDGFAADLPRRLALIEQGWHALANGNWSSDVLSDVHRLVHNLTGAGKTFGFDDISNVARAFETLLREAVDVTGVPAPEVIHAMEMAFLALQASIRDVTQNDSCVPSTTTSTVAVHDKSKKTTPLIYLVEDDALLARDLSLQLRNHGYRVEHFSTLTDLTQGMARAIPQAMLVDFYLPDGEGATVVQRWGRHSGQTIPIVVMSGSAEMETRLLTVRAGADAFMVKPIDINQLIDRLSKLVAPDTTDHYRVLVIDDVQSQAQYVRALLQEAGMLATAIYRPLQALDAIQELDPDVIVLDMYMPDCNGLELAAVIRQFPAYAATSIIFLTSELDVQMQQQALAQGADDYLGKPVDPHRLVATVTSRAQRVRSLRALMTCDSLTGFLNHTAIVDRLETEKARSARNHSPLSVALIDIDRFKAINDSYGHLAGDQVIKGLTHLLRQRLRSSDSMGRLGGEEFLVVMPDTRLADAERIIVSVCEHFAQMAHRYQEHVIGASISCGVASFRNGDTAATLINLADKAMYQAKQEGRNRVVTAVSADGQG